MPNTMTEKQASLIKKLKVERDITVPEVAGALKYLEEAWREGHADTYAASGTIRVLLAAPPSAQERKRDMEVEPGIYKTPDDNLIRVYLGQNSGRMLAKLIVVGGDSFWFQYMGVAKRFVPQGSRRLTVQEVGDATLALNSTVCLVCGKRLDDPESVQRGIGPVCYKNYGGAS